MLSGVLMVAGGTRFGQREHRVRFEPSGCAAVGLAEVGLSSRVVDPGATESGLGRRRGEPDRLVAVRQGAIEIPLEPMGFAAADQESGPSETIVRGREPVPPWVDWTLC